MKLRPDQHRARELVRDQYRAGKRAVVLVAPTGAGKTVVSSSMMVDAGARGTPTLYLTDRRELLAQTVVTLARFGVAAVRVIAAAGAAESICARLVELNLPTRIADDAPITVASIPTLAGARWRDRLPAADFVIIDECHHALAQKTWRHLARVYASAHLLGVTATPFRSDDQGLGDVFDSLVVGASVRELTELGHLVPLRAWSPPEPLGGGRLAMSPLEAYQRFARGRRAIVFANGRAHAAAIADDLRAGVPAGHVDGAMPASKRDAILAAWRRGEMRVVCNHGVLVEGFDDPEVAVCILARRFGSTGAFLQAVGRVLRPHPGKTHATLIDLCGSVLVHGLPDLPRTYSLDGRAISRPDRLAIRQCQACGAVFEAGPTMCPTCGAVLAAPKRKPGRGEVRELSAELRQAVLLANLECAARERGLPPEVAERAAMVLVERAADLHPVASGAHHPELDQPLAESMPGGAPGRYRALSARQFARRNPALCRWVASALGGRAGRLCAEAMAVRAGVWGAA